MKYSRAMILGLFLAGFMSTNAFADINTQKDLDKSLDKDSMSLDKNDSESLTDPNQDANETPTDPGASQDEMTADPGAKQNETPADGAAAIGEEAGVQAVIDAGPSK